MDVRADTASIAVKRTQLDQVKPVSGKTRSLLPEELVAQSSKESKEDARHHGGDGSGDPRAKEEDPGTPDRDQVEEVPQPRRHGDDGEYHLLDAMA